MAVIVNTISVSLSFSSGLACTIPNPAAFSSADFSNQNATHVHSCGEMLTKETGNSQWFVRLLLITWRRTVRQMLNFCVCVHTLISARCIHAFTTAGDSAATSNTLTQRRFITLGWSLHAHTQLRTHSNSTVGDTEFFAYLGKLLLQTYKLPTYRHASRRQLSTHTQHFVRLFTICFVSSYSGSSMTALRI